jgi:hypothetical protein
MPRPPKINALPADVRAWLETTLAQRDHEGYKALEAALRDKGFDISYTSVWRADQRIQRTLSAIRASTEAARLIAQASPDEADEHSAAVIRLVQSALFDAMLKVREAEDADPAEQVKLLSQAARAVADASRASISQKKWADEVATRVAAAADSVEMMAIQGGLSALAVERIRDQVMGIAK